MPSEGPIRRSQLIAPFGVGALTVLPDGTSVVAAGLDHWFERADDLGKIDASEFTVPEWRLQQALGVRELRLPPDYRWSPRAENRNERLKVPFLRFPTWNFCPQCRRLSELPLSRSGRVKCATCQQNPRYKFAKAVSQVPIVAVCSYGHMRDFPWREWAHRELKPTCDKPMTLNATGGASLSAQIVECVCGAKRNLGHVTDMDLSGGPDTTVLSSRLSSTEGERFTCNGSTPWHGKTEPFDCGGDLKASLRAASNLYFSLTKSSIYLPRAGKEVASDLIDLLENPPLSTAINMARGFGFHLGPKELRENQYGAPLRRFSDTEIEAGLKALGAEASATQAADDEVKPDVEDVDFRHLEFAALRGTMNTVELTVRSADLDLYDPGSIGGIGRIGLVERLRETRALWGFNRVHADAPYGLTDRKQLLRRSEDTSEWLPAYIVNGEGLYLELDDDRVRTWESQAGVVDRSDRLQRRFDEVAERRKLRSRVLTPRLVLIHTLAHVLMNRLSFECGYGSASLRERLYISESKDMAGLLIYTASGDSEGTMGGLVRMGRPGYLEPAIRAAFQDAQWCSIDPVCMEIGEFGQGPDSCNLAACHGCALVPETACEEFNRFLDRGLLVGTHEDAALGYFGAK